MFLLDQKTLILKCLPALSCSGYKIWRLRRSLRWHCPAVAITLLRLRVLGTSRISPTCRTNFPFAGFFANLSDQFPGAGCLRSQLREIGHPGWLSSQLTGNWSSRLAQLSQCLRREIRLVAPGSLKLYNLDPKWPKNTKILKSWKNGQKVTKVSFFLIS